MKRSLIFTGMAAMLTNCCYSGALTKDPRTIPVLVAHNRGLGSGCLLHLSNSVYLVTAKHVILSKSEGTNLPTLLSSTIIAKAYSDVGTTNVSERTLSINVARLWAAGEVRYSTNRDIALIRIEASSANDPNVVRLMEGVEITSDAKSLSVYGRDFVCPIRDVDVGADVFMFGYPTSLTGPMAAIFDPSEPLLRKGIVAGVNVSRRTIIIDCPSYFGNSGGPVLQVERPSLDVTSYRLIGLVSGFIPFQEEWENKTMNYSHVLKSNSGYTVIEPTDVILQLVWK